MSLTDWVPIESSAYERDEFESRRANGVEVQMRVSPYDVPEAVRGRYDGTLKRFVIEFKYIQDEPWERTKRDDSVWLRLGSNSGRLIGVELDVEKMNADEVSLKIGTIKQAVSHVHRHRLPKENYDIALRILKDKKAQLERQLSGV